MNFYDRLSATLMFIIILVLIVIGFGKQEDWECAKWEQMQENFEDFYWTEWMIQQCK